MKPGAGDAARFQENCLQDSQICRFSELFLPASRHSIQLQECQFNNMLFCATVFPRDRLCGLVVRVFGYRSGGPGSIPGTTRKKKVVGLERGTLSLVSTTEELLGSKVAAPV
jgi:hypothetical protein